MSLINDVYAAIKNSKEMSTYITPSNVSAFNLPQELIDKTDETVMLITETGFRRGGFAGDYSTKRLETCQIQVWYAPDSDMDGLERTLIHLLEKNHVYSRQSDGHDVDPDTFQVFITLEFWREKGDII